MAASIYKSGKKTFLSPQRGSKSRAHCLAIVAVAALSMVSAMASAEDPERSWVTLQFLTGSIRLELRLPRDDLADATQIPALRTDDAALDKTGPLADYVEQRVRASAPDGSIWSVHVRSLTRQTEHGVTYIAAQLDMRPPAAMPANVLRLNYDVILRELPSHTALVLVEIDWRNGVFSDQPILIGIMQSPVASMIVDRSRGDAPAMLLGLVRLAVLYVAHGATGSVWLLLFLPMCSTLFVLRSPEGRATAQALLASAWLTRRRSRPPLPAIPAAPEVQCLSLHSTRIIMPLRIAPLLLMGLACASAAVADNTPSNPPAEDFATFKAQHMARLQQELACVEAATNFEAMHACRPPPPPGGHGGHGGPPPDGNH